LTHLTHLRLRRPIMASMQTNFKTPIHKALQTRLLQKISMPGFCQIYPFPGLNQVDFVKFRSISGMDMAWSKINHIYKAMTAV